jgi:hypothetical protein
MLAAVTAINQQIHQLAPVLNRPSLNDGLAVKSSDDAIPIAWMLKRHEDGVYLFTVNMRNRPTRGTFSGSALGAKAKVEVLGESRALQCESGTFADDFAPYEVHLYRLVSGR